MYGQLKQYLWIGNLVAILFCTYFLARIVNIYVGRALEVKKAIGVVKTEEAATDVLEARPKSYYNVILERNMFDSSMAVGTCAQDSDCPEGLKCADGACVGGGESVADLSGTPVKTTLPIKLRGVLVVGDGKDSRSTATLEMSGKAGVYAVKGEEKISPGVELLEVQPDRIIISNQGRLEYAELLEEGVSIFGPPSETVAAKSTGKEVKSDTDSFMKEGNKIIIDQREVENALANLAQLYTEIRLIPNVVDGQVDGFKVLSVKPGSVFTKLGLKRGDILSRINGIQLDVSNGFEVFNQLKDQKNFALDITRGGEKRTFEYEIR